MAEARYKNMWAYLIKNNYEDAAIGHDMRCTVCKRILINAYGGECGCRYCFECVKAYLNGESRFCPGNTDDCMIEELDMATNINPDHDMNGKISKLLVPCRYLCGYRCELWNMEEHEKVCQIQPVYSPFTSLECKETQSVTHKINEKVVEEKELNARLLMDCIERLENEIASMKRESVELRTEMGEIRLAREHDEARARETNKLVDQIKEDVKKLKNENKLAKEENDSLKAEIEKYRSKHLEFVAATTQQLAQLRTRMKTETRRKDVMLQRCSRSEENITGIEQIGTMKKYPQQNIEEMCLKQSSKLGDLEKELREMRINSEMHNWGEFVWLIDEWAAKRKSAKDGTCKIIFSETFYSHKNGYKMCLSVNPDGDGVGKGTHLSIGFCLMRGHFDNILSWPFKRHVTLSVINQHTGNDHVSCTVKIGKFPNDVAWNKPKLARNAGFGTSKLIELTSLSSNSDLYRDDKIFIRCVVK